MYLNEKQNTIEELNRFIDLINNESNQKSLILVEGKKDLEALSYLGIYGNIKLFYNFKNITHLVDYFSGRYQKLILLLDSDRRGKIITRKILTQLNEKFVDLNYKKKLLRITKGKVIKIEELKSFYISILEY